ncbi:Nramp family divalent metal transporter [Sunxiuqinia elliptica]|uniref:NRAMP (Natural resistance-associated macrophage protein) metal ion transporters n=1 Tax=Sunxiuqinia elliptica TaxID=655355 RepID=A0A1I2JQB1_9BACT|nr:Nramp family divalent metal transporter [Sunxiuqinia elliptica]SFF56409.1 NRAMP (natural resistance-associated macrophage protein) metal ion transporters [Sunxiuqinia elliptica]
MSIGERVKQIIRSVGPGFIVASAALGPGSITVASRIGSVYGYAFLWVIVVAAISMVAYTSMSLRFGISHERSILQQIAVTYGRWFSVVIGICAFLSASSFQFGNNLGIGIAMEGITGVDERVWPFIFTPLGMLLVFRAGNLYKILEKLMMGMVMIMILAFLFNLILARPDMGQVAQGFVPKSFSLGDLDVVAALVATTFVLNGALYQSYLAQDKGWKIADAKKAQNDTYMGISLLAIISALVIITSAAVLNPLGIVVNSAADMALQLESLFGRYAKVIFSFGLCAAAFSSLMVNAVMGGGLLADGLGLGRSMNEKMPKLFTVVILLVGMLIAVFFKGNVVYALILAQASSILAVPLIAIGILLIVNRKMVMGKLKNGKLQNTLAILGFLLICVMVYFMYAKIISFIQSL